MLKVLDAMTRRMFVASMLWIGTMVIPHTAMGLTFVLPHNGNIVGNISQTTAQYGDTLATLGRRYDMGGYEMLEANPGIDYSNPEPGRTLIVPSRFILPNTREGIVINLAEMRLYYFHPDSVHVSTFPIGVGQAGWDTPLGKTQVVRKREKPTWVVPDSIMANHLEHGQIIPKVKPPGPDNPLGDYAMNLGFANIVIHGTNTPRGVGVRSSHGCIRMLPEDIAVLFHQVKIGTPVHIIHQPTKIGRVDNKLFMETHVPIANSGEYAHFDDVGTLLHQATKQIGSNYQVDWSQIQRIQNRANGYPLPIGTIIN